LERLEQEGGEVHGRTSRGVSKEREDAEGGGVDWGGYKKREGGGRRDGEEKGGRW